MAEGIAGSATPNVGRGSGNERSYLLSLSKADQQYVTVTKVHRKGQEIMFPHANPGIRNLDEVLASADVCDRMVRWSARYLVAKVVAPGTCTT